MSIFMSITWVVLLVASYVVAVYLLKKLELY
jgi:hypothetical protein